MTTAKINTRQTRNFDATLSFGGDLELVFKDGKIALKGVKVSGYNRDNNRQTVADIESTTAKYVGLSISEETIQKLADELEPLVAKL